MTSPTAPRPIAYLATLTLVVMALCMAVTAPGGPNAAPEHHTTPIVAVSSAR